MSARRWAQGLAVVLVAALGVACSPTEEDTRSATAGLPDLDQQLEAERWALDPEESTADGALPSTVVLEFGEDLVTGDATCNTFRAATSTDGLTSLTIGEVATTLVACIPDEGLEAEVEDGATFFSSLTGEHEVDATDPDRLVLTRDGTELVFTAIDDD